MRIFSLVGVSFAAHLPNCNLTDHSVETFDEYSQGSNDFRCPLDMRISFSWLMDPWNQL